MMKYSAKKWIGIVLLHLLTALTMATLVDFCILLFQLGLPWGIQMLTVMQFAAVFFCCFLLSITISAFAGKSWHILAGCFSAAIWVFLAVGVLGWNIATMDLDYCDI